MSGHSTNTTTLLHKITACCAKCNQASKFDEDGNLGSLSLETGSIDWSVEEEDLPALYALHRIGWKPWRIRAELTLALSNEAAMIVRRRLGQLAREATTTAKEPRTARQKLIDSARMGWRKSSGSPQRRAHLRAAAKELFLQDMLDPSISIEEIRHRRWLDPLPDSPALEVAREMIVRPREFLLWDPSGKAVLDVTDRRGTHRLQGYAMLDRGDSVEVHATGQGSDEVFAAGAVSDQGQLQIEAGPNPIHDLLSNRRPPEVIWQDHGKGSFELYFGRVDRILFGGGVPEDWIYEAEDRLLQSSPAEECSNPAASSE